MTEPFAKADEFGCVWILSGTRCIEAPKTWLASTYADNLNTAARKYAADKIREAAKFEDELALLIENNIVSNEAHYRKYPGGKPGQLQAAREKREAAQRLRLRADAVERGEA